MRVCVACRIFARLSVDGHRGRPSGEARFDLLNAVASSPARRAKPEVVRLCRSARRSIADHMRVWDSTRPLRAGPSLARLVNPAGEEPGPSHRIRLLAQAL